eukprot:UN13058
MRNGRCSAFVLYFNAEYAQRSIMKMNNVIPESGIIPLRVELAKRSAEKQQRPPVTMNHIPERSRNYRPSAQAYRTSPLNPGAPKVEIPGLHNTQFPSPLLHSTKVFFFNMITEMPKDFLVNLFGIYGEVDKLEIQTDNDGKT